MSVSPVRHSPNGMMKADAGRYDYPILKYWTEQVRAVAQLDIHIMSVLYFYTYSSKYVSSLSAIY